MLFKLIKHDFMYSAKLFFALGAIAIVIAIIFGAAEYVQVSAYLDQLADGYAPLARNSLPMWHFGIMNMLQSILIIPIGVAAIIHIAQFYRKGMFGRVGHMAMTLPVGRGALLASKLAVAFTWFIYVIGIALIMMAMIYLWSPFIGNHEVFGLFRADNIKLGIEFGTIGFGAIAVLFFCITLAHSVFFGRRVNGVLTGFIGFVYVGIYTWIADMLTRRAQPNALINEGINPDGTTWAHWEWQPPLTGLEYGRIVIGETQWGREVFVDIWLVAVTLAMAGIAIIATRYLLKKRVSLT
ncbi:MAG: hypothetical protein FWE34_09490 [Defluviitaleaceae bacterium]|nr:hypothetical protein [Defluviitaleaceae bacterium]